jgi:hypothetical protein
MELFLVTILSTGTNNVVSQLLISDQGLILGFRWEEDHAMLVLEGSMVMNYFHLVRNRIQ